VAGTTEQTLLDDQRMRTIVQMPTLTVTPEGIERSHFFVGFKTCRNKKETLAIPSSCLATIHRFPDLEGKK